MQTFDTRQILDVMKDTVEFLQASEVAQTSVGIQAYIQGKLLQKKIAVLEKEIEEEDNFIEMLAERAGL